MKQIGKWEEIMLFSVTLDETREEIFLVFKILNKEKSSRNFNTKSTANEIQS